MISFSPKLCHKMPNGHASKHSFIQFTVCLLEQSSVPPLLVYFYCNLSPTHFSLVASPLPLDTFSSLKVSDATESLCSTLSSCLDRLCPLSTKAAHSNQPHPWMTDTIWKLHTDLRAAERKCQKSQGLPSLLSSFSSSISAEKMSFYKDVPKPLNSQLIYLLLSWLKKVAAINNQFSELQPVFPINCTSLPSFTHWLVAIHVNVVKS